jgi:RNA-binding protein YlmH
MSELNGFPTDLGSILVRMGAITFEQLHAAVEKQHLTREKLGDVLVKDNHITAVILLEALELQSGLRTAEGVPVNALSRLFNHAVDSYQASNTRIGSVLDAGSLKR